MNEEQAYVLGVEGAQKPDGYDAIPAAEPLVSTRPRQAIPIGAEVPGVTLVGGIMEMRSLSQMIEDEKAKAERDAARPVVTGIAGHIRKCWAEARDAKQSGAELQMLKNLRQRRGEYEPEMKHQLAQQGSSTIYMMLTSNKCRSASAWLREALGGIPFGCSPTPAPDIDPDTKGYIVRLAEEQIVRAVKGGYFPTDAEVREFMLAVRDQAFAKFQEIAQERAERMTEKMKDQLLEGGFEDALDAFIDDLVTFPAAILKGPVVRVRPQLKWTKDETGKSVVEPSESYKLEWERVSPFDIYPAPDATSIDDGYLIERHKLTRADLVALKDVEGYSAPAINAVLDEYGRGGLREWTTNDAERGFAEGKVLSLNDNPSELIDALQFWGSVQGKMLLDWGVDEADVEDPLAEYHVEAWLVGNWVIKATLNPDPLHRKPYYKTSWESIPGCFWGKSIPELCADTQAMCNACARALVNNISLASGPQVAYDISRMPVGEDLTAMYPWKIWQFKDNGAGATTQPISFFQPNSNASELMGIYEKFAQLADEYTGIPRYMTGDARVGGAGSTASGMSMLMSNAGKSIKNVVASVDRVLKPAIERLYYYNMMYLDDPELKGDVSIHADGATTLLMKQQQEQRQLEFFNIVATNQFLQTLSGTEGVAYMYREILKRMGWNADKITPDGPILKARIAEAQQQMMMQQAQQMASQQQALGQPNAGGTPAKPGNEFDQRQLIDGSPQAVAQVSAGTPQ